MQSVETLPCPLERGYGLRWLYVLLRKRLYISSFKATVASWMSRCCYPWIDAVSTVEGLCECHELTWASWKGNNAKDKRNCCLFGDKRSK